MSYRCLLSDCSHTYTCILTYSFRQKLQLKEPYPQCVKLSPKCHLVEMLHGPSADKHCCMPTHTITHTDAKSSIGLVLCIIWMTWKSTKSTDSRVFLTAFIVAFSHIRILSCCTCTGTFFLNGSLCLSGTHKNSISYNWTAVCIRTQSSVSTVS